MKNIVYVLFALVVMAFSGYSLYVLIMGIISLWFSGARLKNVDVFSHLTRGKRFFIGLFLIIIPLPITLLTLIIFTILCIITSINIIKVIGIL
ncbi:hypothetical protein PVA44_04855 [Entomospira nematocerorum]|uniref:Uncharacterized protein n=1 Tax=Entomospira nematocerorum TaxID=2719987 RepID=A0A968KSK2_9SPIO|nr:hypothetical protein [Entomospira nematocera]NIZ46650.1 hypothetical protein [Entomospira nematocera]WDI33552.1 hypothetical protein PVA44_04855 [Entomospira nematocera]